MRTFGTSHVRFARALRCARARGLHLICWRRSQPRQPSACGARRFGRRQYLHLRRRLHRECRSVAATGCVQRRGVRHQRSDHFSTTTFPVGGANPLFLFELPGGSLIIRRRRSPSMPAPMASDDPAPGRCANQLRISGDLAALLTLSEPVSPRMDSRRHRKSFGASLTRSTAVTGSRRAGHPHVGTRHGDQQHTVTQP